MTEKLLSAKFLIPVALFVGLTLHLNIAGCSNAKSSDNMTNKKVLILGFDGMDPKILKQLVDEEKMPNFKRLMIEGDFKPLKTSMPPQSPVAWSNFITGMNPGGHGIYDFIHRDPKTMTPYLSTTRAETSQSSITIGNWVIPLKSGKVTLLRHGKPFWELLEDNNIPTTVFRVPANFPPKESSTYQISGMGTPDMLGSYGTFFYYTDENIEKFGEVSGGRVIPVKVRNNKVDAKIPGPKNTFKKGAPESFVDFEVYLDKENPVAKIVVQGQQVLLKKGEWSEWVRIQYEIIPLLQSVSGICRFYLKETQTNFKLYVTPVNIDPAEPAMPISSPDSFAHELCEAIGPFYTQGIPEDTKALSEGVLDDSEFLQQADIVMNEELKMFEHELKRFKSGVLFFYMGRVDQLGHMFWRTMDKKHPAHNPETKYESVIESAYVDMDDMLGKAFEKVDDNTTLIVMSDHGFAPFYRAFNLNTWLKNEGYVTLMDDSEGELLLNVSWSRTRAYGLGFNGLYVNLIGREKNGIVRPGKKVDELLEEISKKLLEIRDPKTGLHVIKTVYRAEDIYSGAFLKNAPDLIVGYNKEYRASWETVLGKFPKELLRDNTEKWSGDHLMEADLVPGVLLSNKKIKLEKPALYDLAPTILAEFGIQKSSNMTGKSIF